jgi:flagellar protein FliO/FliZ
MFWGVYFKALISLIFVLGLILALLYFYRRYGFMSFSPQTSRKKRLSIQETLFLDSKRRLIIVKNDEREHLLLIGGTHDLLIENNIEEQDFSHKLSPLYRQNIETSDRDM